MTVTKKTAEVKEETKVNSEVPEVVEKEKFTDKVKAKAESGKGWISRNSGKLKKAAVAGVGAIALGALAVVAKGKVEDGEWTVPGEGEGGIADAVPFEGGSDI